MASRRHRIIIKPNIRPAAPKAGGITPKLKASPANAAIESPSPGIRPQPVPLQEEIYQRSANEDDRKTEAASDFDTSKQRFRVTVDIPERDTTEGISSEADISTVKEQSGTFYQGEVAAIKTDKAITCNEEISNDVLGNISVNSLEVVLPSAGARTAQAKTPKSITPIVRSQTPKSKDTTDSAALVKVIDSDDEAATPMETDGSYLSETMSLDAEDERKEDAGGKILKKRRWRKSKKLRAEPLPSREKSPDRQKMKMSDLLSWNPQQNFYPKKNKKKAALESESCPESPSSIATGEDKELSNQSASLPAPQVMIGPDGSVVLNAESLIIPTAKDDSRPKEVFEDDDEDRYLNANTYRKYKKPKIWTERETEKFFIGLSMCGTDFSLLTNLLPQRSRRELKNKFQREERRNRDLIDKALANRQQYDLKPFEKMAAEEEKKKKKELKKVLKKEKIITQKTKTGTKKRGRKRKRKASEDEEDDWGSDYDEENEENQNNEGSQDANEVSVFIQNSKVSRVKKESDNQNRHRASEQNIAGFIQENPNAPFLPGYRGNPASSAHQSLLPNIPQYPEYIDLDLDEPVMRNRPTKTYSKSSSPRTSQQQEISTGNTGAAFNPGSTVIHAIPGSNQVQIEVEGVQNPVQGVLIPSHLVSMVAPQLGIQGNTAGMQVLLVQEETDSGSLVHVYVIPQGDTPQSSGDNIGVGTPRLGGFPAFSSPLPSPYPSTPIQNLPTSPFTSSNSTHHPLSARSPHPNSHIDSSHLPQVIPDYVHGKLPQSCSQQNPDLYPNHSPFSSTKSSIDIGASQHPTLQSIEAHGRASQLHNSVNIRDKTSVQNEHMPSTKNDIITSTKNDLVILTKRENITSTDLTATYDSVPAQIVQSVMPTHNAEMVPASTCDRTQFGSSNVVDVSSGLGVSSSVEYESDCVIIDPNHPQSQLDMSTLSNV